MFPDQKMKENNDCTTLGFIRRLKLFTFLYLIKYFKQEEMVKQVDEMIALFMTICSNIQTMKHSSSF